MNEIKTENVNRSLSTYQSLCTEYYDLDKPNAPEDALTFYLEYARKSNGPILEPMCGSGRFLLPMSEMGIDLTGFDASLGFEENFARHGYAKGASFHYLQKKLQFKASE